MSIVEHVTANQPRKKKNDTRRKKKIDCQSGGVRLIGVRARRPLEKKGRLFPWLSTPDSPQAAPAAAPRSPWAQPSSGARAAPPVTSCAPLAPPSPLRLPVQLAEPTTAARTRATAATPPATASAATESPAPPASPGATPGRGPNQARKKKNDTRRKKNIDGQSGRVRLIGVRARRPLEKKGRLFP
jgi:hypothetical protein